MSALESPLNVAHQHAANADDFLAQGLLIPAAEEHYKAAEGFMNCIDASNDENTKRTLRMLYNEHSKAGKELQRKIAKLREENKDPSLPYKPTATATSPNRAVQSTTYHRQAASSPPPQVPGRMSDSQQTADESFMILGSGNEPGDAFNHFWKITEGMLEHLSQPVAFATAPLSPGDSTASAKQGSAGPDTDTEDALTKTFNRGLDFVKAAKSKMLSRHDSSGSISDNDTGRAGITTFPPKPQPTGFDDDWDDELSMDDDGMSDSFFMVPSKNGPSSGALKKENDILKAQLDETQKKLAMTERMLKQRQDQDMHLRESIMLARKEAQRAMASSIALRAPPPPSPLSNPAIGDIGTLNVPVPPTPLPTPPANPAGRDREGQLVRRVRELEEEVRNLKTENEKQKVMIVKFRERWEKLKESAKRKKEAKAAAAYTSVVNDRIEEDPEAEAEAEKEDSEL